MMQDDAGLMNDLLTFLEQQSTEGGPLLGGSAFGIEPMPTANWASGQVGLGIPLKLEGAASERSGSLSGDAPGNGSRKAPARQASKRQRDNDKVKELEALAAAKLEQLVQLAQRNADLKLRNTVLSDAVHIRELQLRVAKGVPIAPMPVAEALSAATSVAEVVWLPGSVKLTQVPELQPSIDPDSIRPMGRLQLVGAWKAYLERASALLLTLEDSPVDEDAAVGLRKTVAEISFFFRTSSMLAPEATTAFLQTHMETEAVSAPPPGHWARVLNMLQLTAEQSSELSAVYGLFCGIMRGILDERRTINQALAAGLAQQQQQEAEAGNPQTAVTTSRQMTVPPEAEVMPALQRNMRKEAGAHLLLRGFLFGRTLSMVQFARAAVHSYPFFPSATALTAAAAGVAE